MDQFGSHQSPSILAWEKSAPTLNPESLSVFFILVWQNMKSQHRAGIKAAPEEQVTLMPCARTSSKKSFSDKRLTA